MIPLCKCIPALFSVPPPIQLHCSYWTVPFWIALCFGNKRDRKFLSPGLDPDEVQLGQRARLYVSHKEQIKIVYLLAGLSLLGFTNRVSKDHRGKVENTTQYDSGKGDTHSLTMAA